MQPAPIPASEPARLAELRGLGVLDTPAEERFDRITRIAKRAFRTKIAVVSLVDADRQWFKSSQGLPGTTETPRAISFCGHAIIDDEIFVVPDARKDDRFHDNPLVTGEPHIRFYAGKPIHGPGGQRVGTLCVIDPAPRQMAPDERELLEDLAILVENELRLDLLTQSERELRVTLSEVERRAAIDSLTRMWNRDSIFRLLDLELERSQRAGDGVGVAMVDIDHFKAVNDTHGHQVGDEVLAAVAARIRMAMRNRDLVGRYGGEEFLVVFAAADPATLAAVAERIRDQVAQTPIPCSSGPLQVTVSIGVCSSPPNLAIPRDQLIGAADRALYAAKHGGRNRVEVAATEAWAQAAADPVAAAAGSAGPQP